MAAILLGSAGRICANTNFQRLYRALRGCTAAGASCELAPALALGAECTPTTCPLCMRCQVALTLAGLVAVGHCLYAAELRQRAAFLAARPPSPAGLCGDGAGADEPAPVPAPGLSPRLADYWLSFALPATCALFSYVAASQM